MPTPSSQRRGVALLFFVCVLGGMLAAGCPMTRGETLPTVPAQIVEPAGHETAVEPTPAPPRYPPESWMAALDPTARGEAISLACLDANGDLHINGSDLTHLAGFDIALAHGYGCMPSTTRREWFEAEAAVRPASQGGRCRC